MKYILMSLGAFCMPVVFGRRSFSQTMQSTFSLSEFLLSTIPYGTLNSMGAPLVSPQLTTPLFVIPNLIVQDPKAEALFARFDSVPAQNGAFNPNEVRNVKSALLSLAHVIELSKPQTSLEEKSELSQAYSLLYLDDEHQVPTPEYEQYLAYQAQVQQQVNRLQQGGYNQNQTDINSTIASLQTDWTVLGHKQEIEAALATVDQLSADDERHNFLNWKSTIDGGSSVSINLISEALSSLDWLRISQSPSTSNQLTFSASVGAQSFTLPAIDQITFEAKVVNIPRLSLDHPFLKDRNWKTTNGDILSDGGGTTPDSQQLLPRIFSTIIIVRNVEIHFMQRIPLEFVDALQGAISISLCGLPLSDLGSATVSYQEQGLISPCSIVLASAGAILPQIPNPTPGLTWPD